MLLQQIETQQQVHSTSPQQVVEEAASLTTSWTTCRTASPQQIRSKLHATIRKPYSKSHNLLYNKSTANRSNGVRHLFVLNYRQLTNCYSRYRRYTVDVYIKPRSGVGWVLLTLIFHGRRRSVVSLTLSFFWSHLSAPVQLPTQWRKLGAEFGGRKIIFAVPPNWEILGGRRGTHCTLELNVG